jgi:hypothetical protein
VDYSASFSSTPLGKPLRHVLLWIDVRHQQTAQAKATLTAVRELRHCQLRDQTAQLDDALIEIVTAGAGTSDVRTADPDATDARTACRVRRGT